VLGMPQAAAVQGPGQTEIPTRGRRLSPPRCSLRGHGMLPGGWLCPRSLPRAAEKPDTGTERW